MTGIPDYEFIYRMEVEFGFRELPPTVEGTVEALRELCDHWADRPFSMSADAEWGMLVDHLADLQIARHEREKRLRLAEAMHERTGG